jgi:hypothetical protein
MQPINLSYIRWFGQVSDEGIEGLVWCGADEPKLCSLVWLGHRWTYRGSGPTWCCHVRLSVSACNWRIYMVYICQWHHITAHAAAARLCRLARHRHVAIWLCCSAPTPPEPNVTWINVRQPPTPPACPTLHHLSRPLPHCSCRPPPPALIASATSPWPATDALSSPPSSLTNRHPLFGRVRKKKPKRLVFRKFSFWVIY